VSAGQQRVARVERREVVKVFLELFGFLAALAVRVFFAADDDGVYCDEDC
jgi:hypothetical protein